jgi:phenylpropionate dioxygenase-like ring-hydroxylating dioxygenase large terminal subunit
LPVEERHGFVWVFIGDGTPPPLDDDLPEELLRPDAVIGSRLSVWRVHWRVAVDNGVDLAHVPFLHRSHPLVRFKRLPSYFKVRSRREGPWLRASLEDVGFSADYPRIGRWPRDLWLRRAGKPTATACRLPGIVRISFPDKYTHIRWAVPIDETTTQSLQMLVRHVGGLGAQWFKLYYYGWLKWLYHVSFQRQDEAVLETIEQLQPEALTQSDAIVIQWRRMAAQARGAGEA